MQLCYFGEFGYFNTIVLGYLSKYIVENTNKILYIRTFDDYCKILNILFPAQIITQSVPLTNKRVFNSVETNDIQINSNEVSLVDFLDCNKTLFAFDFKTMLQNKIIFTNNIFENKYKTSEGPITLIFPRHRHKYRENLDFEYRNMTRESLDKSIEMINDIYIGKSPRIIIIGKTNEILDIVYPFEIVSDIHEMIYLLNNAELLITPDSGMIDFAKNCGCKNIAIFSNYGIVDYHYKYNAFGSNIYSIFLQQSQTIPKFRSEYIIKNNLRNSVKHGNRPFVSCVCPTYNRKDFLPKLLTIFDQQTYPKENRELIILDDSPENNEKLIEQHKKDNIVRYYHLQNKIPIGKKRNMLNQLAKGEYVVCFDDDDFYFPERISHAITKMISSKINLAGSSILHIYYQHLNKIYQFGPYGINHGTNGTLAYHIDFTVTHFYNDNAAYAEEGVFLNHFTEKMVQLDPFKTMLCIAHDTNTYDKKKLLNSGKDTGHKLKHFVKNKDVLKFYKQ